MPEAAEVRIIAEELQISIQNGIINNITMGINAKVKNMQIISLPTKIVEVKSYGKKVIMVLNDQCIVFSLGMTGKFKYTKTNHTHVTFNITKNNNTFDLYYDDARRIGGLEALYSNELDNYLSKLGPNLLQCALVKETWISLDTWISRFTMKKYLNKQIAVVLHDQSIIAGIGNYLMSEILYYSKILPQRLVKDISNSEWDNIRIYSHVVVYLAYICKGNTIKDFETLKGHTGKYGCIVYGRKFDPYGNPVTCENVKTGRKAHWVNNVQT